MMDLTGNDTPRCSTYLLHCSCRRLGPARKEVSLAPCLIALFHCLKTKMVPTCNRMSLAFRCQVKLCPLVLSGLHLSQREHIYSHAGFRSALSNCELAIFYRPSKGELLIRHIAKIHSFRNVR